MMIVSYLSSLLGIFTLFIGDEYGITGNEDKSKNKWRRNRGIIPLSKISDSKSITGYTMNHYASNTIHSTWAKTHSELAPIKDGCYYEADVLSNGKTRDYYKTKLQEISIKLKQLEESNAKNSPLYINLLKEQKFINSELAKVAIMMQNTDGDIAISVFNAGGIYHDNRVNYFDKLSEETGIDLNNPELRKQFFEENNINSVNINNPYVPIQKRTYIDAILLGAGASIPLGTKFINANGIDGVEYVVKKLHEGIGIVRKDGQKIAFDGFTGRNGVMVLRKAFRGRQKNFYNEKFNIPTNVYEKPQNKFVGKNFSITK